MREIISIELPHIVGKRPLERKLGNCFVYAASGDRRLVLHGAKGLDLTHLQLIKQFNEIPKAARYGELSAANVIAHGMIFEGQLQLHATNHENDNPEHEEFPTLAKALIEQLRPNIPVNFFSREHRRTSLGTLQDLANEGN